MNTCSKILVYTERLIRKLRTAMVLLSWTRLWRKHLCMKWIVLTAPAMGQLHPVSKCVLFSRYRWRILWTFSLTSEMKLDTDINERAEQESEVSEMKEGDYLR